MKNIVLFDMDGTLTPPRQALDHNLLGPLKVLTRYSDIGIVTGSDIEYIQQQLNLLIINSKIRYNLHLCPCNGTKHYTPPSYNHQEHALSHSASFLNNIGPNNLSRIMKILIDYQNHISSHYSIPLTGHFISYRDSMINWSPIGRNASLLQRKEFIEFDRNFTHGEFRKLLLNQLKEEFENIGLQITVKLGGQTSFDIYPIGWDKTYVLRHFQDYKVWFVGDKCVGDGNDKEIYEKLQPKNSFKVSSTKETKEVIQNIIDIFRSQDER